VEFTVGDVPTQPTGLGAVVNAGTEPTATLTWDVAETATAYVVTVYDADGEIVETSGEIATTEWTTTAGKLQLGATYSVTVVASNVYGNSVASEAVEFIVGNAPAAPSDLTFGTYDEAKRTLAMTWADNSNNETRFRVEYSVNGGVWRLATNLGTNATGRTATGVDANSVYGFRVRAENAYGVSAWVENTYATTPAAATELTATVNAGAAPTATLTWVDNAQYETGYEVQLLNGETWETVAELDADATTWTTGTLELGATYQYRVVAVNDDNRAATEAVEVVVGNVPAQPTGLGAVVNAATEPTATVSWLAVETATGYVVTVYDANGEIVETSGEIATLEWTTTAGKLQLGATYSVSVVASNVYGNSVASEAVKVVVGNVADAPVLSATVNASTAPTATLKWADLATETGYRVEIQTENVDGETVWETVAELDAGATTWATGTLELGATYQYRVVAVNAYGETASNVVEVVVGNAPAAPSDLTFGTYDEAKRTLAMTWADNSNNETRFRVEYSVNGGAWRLATNLDANATGRTARGVDANSVYGFRVRAENAYGVSAWVENTYATTPAAATELTATVNAGVAPTATLTWVDNAKYETGYEVQLLNGETWETVAELDAGATTWTTGTLELGATYQYRVVVKNADNQAATEAVEVVVGNVP
ncbi:MAG: hypothetical protein IJ991_06205, partial [Thermoguttaceae bacterium]|nr:hypothetical protein [Thermoguttaceae bacterium]